MGALIVVALWIIFNAMFEKILNKVKASKNKAETRKINKRPVSRTYTEERNCLKKIA